MDENKKNNLQKVLEFIKDYLDRNQKTPTVREIASAIGVSSTSTVVYYLRKLEKKGFISIEGKKSRNIKLKETAFLRKQIPILGLIRAGIPTYAEENIEGYLNVDDFLFQKGDFLLRVKGDSMKDAGIFDGDLVLVKQTPVINPGEIGVFMIDGESTIKQLGLENGHPVLIPKNRDYSPIYPKELVVIGRVTAVIRDLD
ncbi:MAG: transcriptional repressor LexA [Actinobacteria bacterium]|nr:transcriptional repressor LexA [Actinomycetota bacterium]